MGFTRGHGEPRAEAKAVRQEVVLYGRKYVVAVVARAAFHSRSARERVRFHVNAQRVIAAGRPRR